MATYDEFQQKAAEMVLSPKAQAAFDIEKEKAELRDSYGHHTFGQSCLLARRLIEREAVCHRQLQRLGPSQENLPEPRQKAADA